MISTKYTGIYVDLALLSPLFLLHSYLFHLSLPLLRLFPWRRVMKILLNHWSYLPRDLLLPPSLPLAITNPPLLVGVVVLLVEVVAVVAVVINATVLFVVRFVVGKGITPLLAVTTTPTPQILPTLWRLLPHAHSMIIKILIGIQTLEPLRT
jgi:hypothetical protein